MNPSRIYVSDLGIKAMASLLAIPAFRRMGKNLVDKKIREKIEQERQSGVPTRMIEDQAQMIRNMINVVDRWLSNKNVKPAQARMLFQSFGSMMHIKNKAIADAFHARFGYDTPRFITISPTKRCNLKCIGCYAASSCDTDVTLEWDTVDKIVTQQKQLWGSHFTNISGGEPFMYKSQGKTILDLFEKHHDTFFLMYTNGTLITKEVAKRLASLGNVTPSISVEGFEPDTDYRRGKGVHKKVLQAFENLREAGVLYGISVTVTNKNMDTIFSQEFMDEFIRRQGVYYGWIFQYMPVGRSYSLDLMVPAEKRFEMFEKMQNWIYNDGFFLADFWNSGTVSNGCLSAGRKGGYIYIDWNGNVMPCVFNPYTTTNIKKVFSEGGTINDAIDSPFFKKIRQWQNDYFDHGTDNSGRGNILTPCPMRDHHKMMRGIIDEVNAQPADENADEALEDREYYNGMVAYGEAIKEATREHWETEYLGKKKTRKKATA
ncbi:MAG: radical SAM protein [Spirochaetales bacterium]|nr:MAG: radical SAM protein [Spirochaetales bacterium]